MYVCIAPHDPPPHTWRWRVKLNESINRMAVPVNMKSCININNVSNGMPRSCHMYECSSTSAPRPTAHSPQPTAFSLHPRAAQPTCSTLSRSLSNFSKMTRPRPSQRPRRGILVVGGGTFYNWDKLHLLCSLNGLCSVHVSV